MSMFIVIWEYHVKSEHLAEFEEIYSADGAWTKLFQKGEGYRGTELLRDGEQPRRYVTIDRWASSEHYRKFRAERAAEYTELDTRCAGLTERELSLGTWESVRP